MFLVDQIVTAVADAFAADPNMLALVPGGIWHRRAPDEEHGLTRPYAILSVVPQAKEFISNYSAIQGFVVVVQIYAGQDVADAGEIADFLGAWDFDPSQLVSSGLPGRVLGLYPVPEEIDLDDQTKLGQDMVIATKSWFLNLHIALMASN